MNRGAKIFLVVFVVLFLLAVTAGITAVALAFRPGVPERSWLQIELRGEVLDYDPVSEFKVLFGGAGQTLSDAVFSLREAKDDERIAGAIVKLQDAGMGFGKYQELRAAILDFRSSGKPVYAWLEWAGNGSYYASTACDRVFLLPTGELNLIGLHAEPMFFKGSLDKLKIEPVFLQREEYKSAAESFTNREMSPYLREQIESLLDAYAEELRSAIGKSRNLSAEAVQVLVDRGPYNAREAHEKQLVDELLYWDQLEDKLTDEGKGTKGGRSELRTIGARRYLSTRSIGSGASKIAIVFAQGPILPGEDGGSGIFGGTEIRADSFARSLRAAREDDSVKAVVLRVDSPGGSAIGSDVIWREVVLTREKKPVVVSMADVAGSGGYWISMAADEIVAQPATITGSIGVVFGKLNMHGFYDWIGVTKDGAQRGENAAIWSDYHAFTETELEAVNRSIQFIYDEFLRKVAQGRGMDVEAVRRIAKGRIWTGDQAKANGLVDRVGGLPEAIAAARSRAGIAEDAEVGLVFLPRAKGFFEELREAGDVRSRVRFPEGLARAGRAIALADELRGESALALCPVGGADVK